MKKITVDDLMKWEEENEEALIPDGPWYFTLKQDKMFVDRINQRQDILNFLGVSSIKFLDEIEVMVDGDTIDKDETEKYKEIVYTMFADFLNDINYPKSNLE